MRPIATRREFLSTSVVTATVGALGASSFASEADSGGKRPINVVVWDERQPAQKEAYENFLGNAIADSLKTRADFSVKSVALGDPQQGLGPGVLEACDVLIWWGHARQAEVTPETGKKIVERIKSGSLSLIALHSAHWSTPFVEAMYERARMDLAASLASSPQDQVEVQEVPPPQRYTVPKSDAPLTPRVFVKKFPQGEVQARLELPYCCFPAYRADGKPSSVRVLLPEHPIAKGIPARFEIPQTEMYAEPFHVPAPDEVVFEERWAPGEWFRSGSVWKLGKGKVFYFRPGHETYPVYRQELPLRILANAVAWLGSHNA